MIGRLTIMALALVASSPAPVLAESGALFQCFFRGTVEGVEHEAEFVSILVEPQPDGQFVIEVDDPSDVLGGNVLSQFQGSLSATPGHRRFTLKSNDSDPSQLLLTLGSAREPQFFQGTSEVLVGILGIIEENDPREGSCLTMTGEVREVFESPRDEGINS